MVISDHGSQFMAASKEIAGWEDTRTAMSRSGTKWHFTATGCPWRNGLAERGVQQIKKTLKLLEAELGNLNVMQLEMLFLRCSMIANRRSISARLIADDDAYAIIPADLLLGRATNHLLSNLDIEFWEQETEAAEQVPGVRGKLKAMVKAWWDIWIARAFPLLLPRRKWAVSQRNVMVGDVVHVQYDNKVSKTRYRLGIVLRVHPDKYGVTRTVTVGLRDRQGVRAEPINQCRTTLQHLKVGVQRLVVVLPNEEGKEAGHSIHTPRGHEQAQRHEMLTRSRARALASPGGTVDQA